MSQVNGTPVSGSQPLPYKKTADTPNLGAIDQSDDIRGGMGFEGLTELAKFVEQGGTLITEGSTATIFPEYGLTTDVSLEQPAQLFVRGSVLRTRIADPTSPIMYGYAGRELPVYFNQAPVLNTGFGAARGGGPSAGPNAGLGQAITPNAVPLRISPYEPEDGTPSNERPRPEDIARVRGATQAAAGAGRGGSANSRTRVVLQFPADADDLLLSGTIANGQFLASRAAAVDSRLGQGHVVMFAIRPFWRWQSHGTYTLGFNAIMNWNDLDAK